MITGDLLVNPISFALSSYPTGWLRTLEKIDALDAAVLVPGHGEPLRDKMLLHATMDVMREMLKAGKDAKARGLDPDQAREEVFPRLHDDMLVMTKDDPKLNEQFRIYFVDWYMHRVYDELDGPADRCDRADPPAKWGQTPVRRSNQSQYAWLQFGGGSAVAPLKPPTMPG